MVRRGWIPKSFCVLFPTGKNQKFYFIKRKTRKTQKVSLESHKTKAEIEPDLLNLYDKFIKKKHCVLLVTRKQIAFINLVSV